MVSPATVRARVTLPVRLGEVETVAEVVTFDGLVDGLEHRATASLVDLDAALERLEGRDPNMVRLIEMRFFAGSTLEEAASTLGITTRTAIRWWNTGRAWLKMELERE